MAAVTRAIGADPLRSAGRTGAGVGVALIDTGVAPVDGLRAIVNGPDLSLDSQAPGTVHLDAFGHGTHLAGIIAGSDGQFSGIAPGATLTSVKVGAADGAVDVTTVIAAVDWVVAHRNDDPRRPIRVLNLSYGTDGNQDHRLDPLTHAVENAWRAGIVVVAAGGNGGTAAPRLTNPAYDPYVIAVGAADTAGSPGIGDDTVADFSSRGDTNRRVDLIAPGRSIVSLRDPGSYADRTAPTARVGDRYFRGSGTSQAAAVVSGAVALLLQGRPQLSPDQVKAALISTARPLPRADAAGQGAGELDLARATAVVKRPARQEWPTSTGTGSLEAARGTAHLVLAGTALTGENDLFGRLDTAAWAAASSAGTAWVGGRWMGRRLTGDGWTGTSATARTWSSLTWSGLTWSGLTWSSLTWSGLTWSGLTWSSLTWSGLTWSGLTWSSLTWSGLTWSGLT
jgi:serine protease AprX